MEIPVFPPTLRHPLSFGVPPTLASSTVTNRDSRRVLAVLRRLGPLVVRPRD